MPKSLKLSLCLFAVAFLVRLPLVGTNFYKTPDAVEYLNPALNFVRHRQLLTTLKVTFLDSRPLPYSPVGERPIGFSLFLIPWLFISRSPSFIQTLLLLFHSVNAALIFLLFQTFIPLAYAFLAALLFALNPNVLITNRLIMPEPVYLFFVLLSLLFLKNKPPHPALAGFTLGLAYLVRPEAVFLIIPLLFYYLIHRQSSTTLKLLTVALLTTLPYFFLNYRLNHQLFKLLEANHFRVTHFSQLSTQFPPPSVSTAVFINQHLPWILSAQLNNLLLHLKHLLSFPWLGLLFLPLFFCPKRFFKTHFVFFIYPLLSFLLISLTWSLFPEPERMLLIPFLFLLLFALKGLSRLPHLFQLILVFTTLITYSAFNFHRLTWAKTDLPNYLYSYNQPLIAWINQHTQPQDTIAYIDPWTINLATNRKSVIFPTNLNPTTLSMFINQYQIDYIITSSSSATAHLPNPVFITSSPDLAIFPTH